MSAAFDWLVVGAGFAGAVMAERLADAGVRVLVIDKRPHIAGNAYDRYDEAGVLIHQYGPHIFHTNAPDVFHYLSRFTEWRPYEHRVLGHVDGKLVPIPINLDTINTLYGLNLSSAELEEWFKARAEPIALVKTSEDVVVSKIGRELYEKFFRGYTRKQWDLDPSQLDKSVTARVPVRTNRDDRYFTARYQAMPAQGYTAMFARMLRHPRITIRLGVTMKALPPGLRAGRTIYTGPIDEFFDCRYGRLPYRSLRFHHVSFAERLRLPVGTINYPQTEAYTRVSEYKHMTGQDHEATTLTYEYPCAEGDPYYPIPRPQNQALYARYAALASERRDVVFIGRLATYKYLNMDQVTAQALAAFASLAGKSSWKAAAAARHSPAPQTVES